MPSFARRWFADMEFEGPALILAAHADDETIGAGIWMRRADAAQVRIVHITNGSPRDTTDARRAGFETAERYARARRLELLRAVGIAGIRPAQCSELGFTDQEAYLHLAELTKRVGQLIATLGPGLILTHPYEGGHPDHDSAAFAVAHALQRVGSPRPLHYEFACYHAGVTGMVTGEFLPDSRSPEETIVLTEPERELKRAMIESFVSQEHMLCQFPLDREKFRPAPEYDFSRPPHEGELQYERFGFGITGEDWRRQAAGALDFITQRAFI